MTNTTSLLPLSERFQQVPARLLLPHGFLLHVASLVGPLRASSQFRATHPSWFREVVVRVWQEYGLNLMLFVVGFMNVAVFAQDLFWQVAGSVLVLLGVPALTCLQMVIDRLRGDMVFRDAQVASAGLTVRVEQVRGVPVVRFFNHFGLPIGRGHGVAVRSWLMAAARQNNGVLVCRAQSQAVADYYLSRHPGGQQLSVGKMPLLAWNHSDMPVVAEDFSEHRGGMLKSLIGWHSNRNSGGL